MNEKHRAAMQQALEALKAGDRYIDMLEFELSCDQLPFYDEGPHQDREKVQAAIADLEAIIAALAEPKPEPVEDPFADLRGKRMGELTAEQTDRATELWLREQIGPWEGYWYPHLQALFRVIDRLRAQQSARQPLTDEEIVDAVRDWRQR